MRWSHIDWMQSDNSRIMGATRQAIAAAGGGEWVNTANRWWINVADASRSIQDAESTWRVQCINRQGKAGKDPLSDHTHPNVLPLHHSFVLAMMLECRSMTRSSAFVVRRWWITCQTPQHAAVVAALRRRNYRSALSHILRSLSVDAKREWELSKYGAGV